MAKYSVSYKYEIVDKYSKTIDKIKRKTNDFVHSASKATMKASLAFQKFGKDIRDVGYKLSAFVTAPVLLFAKSTITATKETEKMQNKLKASLSSFADAKTEMSWLNNEAQRMGIYLPDLADGFSGFSAAALRSGLSIEQTRQIFQDMSETSVSMKMSADDVKGVFRALEQISSKGVLSMEELKLQLGDRLPGAVQIAAKSMDMTAASFIKAVSTGKIMSDDFLPRFAKQIKTELGGAFDEASKSILANEQRTRTSFFKMKNSIYQSGVGTAYNELLIKLNKLMDWFLELSPSTKKWITYTVALVAALAPLLIILGSILAILPLVTAGFWLMVASISALSSPITVFLGLGLGVYLGKLLFKIESVTQAWNGLKEAFSGKAWMEQLSVLGENLHVAVTHGVLGEEAGSRAAEKVMNRRNVAADGAKGKDGSNGTVIVKAEQGSSIVDILGTGLKGAIGFNMAGAR